MSATPFEILSHAALPVSGGAAKAWRGRISTVCGYFRLVRIETAYTPVEKMSQTKGVRL
jgi:hypothetical protein